jgi:type II secretory pathway pseudopilin PulG
MFRSATESGTVLMKSLKSIVLILAKASVVLLILGFLILLFTPRLRDVLEVSNEVATLSKMKQLHLATQQMAYDGVTTSNSTLGWPGDTGGSFSNWTSLLVHDGYFSENDLRRNLAIPGMIVSSNDDLSKNSQPILVYAVRESSPDSAVFLTSANFTNTPDGGILDPKAKPYGNKSFVVYRKAGDGAILQVWQVGMTNIIGSYVPLCR